MAVARMKKPLIHLEIQRPHSDRPLGLWRTTFRDPVTKKIRHKTMGTITGVSLADLRRIQAKARIDGGPALPPVGDVNSIPASDASASVAPAANDQKQQNQPGSCIFSPDDLKIVRSREEGASKALFELAKDIGLDKMLYSRTDPWVRSALAMIIGRIVYQGSKLSLSHCGDYSALWNVCGVEGPIDVNTHCYEVMDRLLDRQTAIQKQLVLNHLSDGCLVLYDITSSYLEGEYSASELIGFGYNRDGKRGHEQIVIGLITNSDGCPVAIEVFPGNTQDASTVEGKIKELRNTYGLKDIVFVGDRGMVTQSNEEKLQALPEGEGIKIISALTHREIVDILERTGNTPELFDDKNIIEITEPDDEGRRYCLCRNPYNAERFTKKRQDLLAYTELEMQRVATTALRSQSTKAPASAELIGARVNKVLEQTKMGKYVEWKVAGPGVLDWKFDEEQISADRALDGCYVIKTTVSKVAMDKEQVVARYKGLSKVEQAFRNLKTVSLELRPIRHRKDERIEAHVFLCMLAYYLQWHMVKRLEPLLSEQREAIANKKMAIEDRKWTLSHVIEVLKSIRSEELIYEGVRFTKETEPTAEQARLLMLLRTRSPKEGRALVGSSESANQLV